MRAAQLTNVQSLNSSRHPHLIKRQLLSHCGTHSTLLSWCVAAWSTRGVLRTATEIFSLACHFQRYLRVTTNYCVPLPHTIRRPSLMGGFFSISTDYNAGASTIKKIAFPSLLPEVFNPSTDFMREEEGPLGWTTSNRIDSQNHFKTDLRPNMQTKQRERTYISDKITKKPCRTVSSYLEFSRDPSALSTATAPHKLSLNIKLSKRRERRLRFVTFYLT